MMSFNHVSRPRCRVFSSFNEQELKCLSDRKSALKAISEHDRMRNDDLTFHVMKRK